MNERYETHEQVVRRVQSGQQDRWDAWVMRCFTEAKRNPSPFTTTREKQEAKAFWCIDTSNPLAR